MKNLIKKILADKVLCIAFVLAAVSALFVRPSAAYAAYPDYRTLCMLFSLMTVIGGLQKENVFRWISGGLIKRTGTTRGLVQALTAFCFFGSMFITNDVALITFVPLAIMVLEELGRKDLIIKTVVLQTIAANLGSMLLPVGNPQNLYLYGLFGMSFGGFVLTMLPIWLLSLVLAAASTLLFEKAAVEIEGEQISPGKRAPVYAVLFVLCLLAVPELIDYRVLTVITAAAVLITDRKVLAGVDYLLLLTFCCFFVFIGNIKNMPAVAEALRQLIEGRELLLGVLLSQCISNVPAAILLSGFTDNARALLWGTDIGGLGTLIASLASLISYKLYMKSDGADGRRYLGTFTIYNLAFLAVLTVAAALLINTAAG